MKREEFLARLEQGLVGLGEEERAEALKFYNEYLDEVGPGQEEQEIARLGDPRRVANIIRANLGLGPAPHGDGAEAAPETAEAPCAARQEPGLSPEGMPGQQGIQRPQPDMGSLNAGGEEDAAVPKLTLESPAWAGRQSGEETGPAPAPGSVQDVAQQVRQAASAAVQRAQAAWKSAQPHVQAAASSAYEAARASVKAGTQGASAACGEARSRMGDNGVLWLIIIILTFPVWIGVLGGIFGALFGIIGGLCGLVLGGFGVILGGVLALVRSLLLFASAPMNAVVNMGLSLVCMALGGVLAGIGVAVVQRLVPWVFGLIGRLAKWVSGKVGGRTAVFFINDAVDPHIARKAVQPVVTKQHHAVRHLYPYAGHGQQGLLQRRAFCPAQSGKIQCARGGKTRRLMHIACAVAKAAGRKLAHGKARKPARRGESKEAAARMADGRARAQAQLLYAAPDGRDAFAL